MNRTEKQDLVASLHEAFGGTSIMVVAHYTGLTVKEMTALRGRIREAGASFKVTKNRLTRLALKDTKFEGLGDLFTGPTAVAYSENPVAAAKAMVDFGKTNEKLVILGGALDKQRLDANGIKALASLPSLDELRARIVGMVQTPATRIAGVLQAPAGQLARVLGAYAKKGEAA